MEPPTVPTLLPSLGLLPPSTKHTFLPPAKQINSGPDVEHFLTSKAYRDICTFVLQLNRSLCPRRYATKGTQIFALSTPRNDPEIVTSLQSLLAKVENIISEAPPDPGPRRFGNISFRRWHEILEGRVEGLLREFLPAGVLEGGSMVELKAYFVGGFGSSQRMDYGTGHELSFVAFLGCLWKLGGFSGSDEDGEVERSVVFGVIEPYLKVIRKLILTYTLEPAGSHGVWGLDDHSFLPYVFGSAQFSRPIARNSNEPMPLEGSCPGAPKPADIVKADKVNMYRDENMYFSAVGFINDVKTGPFWEHSPILFDVSGIKDGWGKINKGMVKMFNAEVLSKFPVVQHFPFGSMFSWERDPDAMVPVASVHTANQPAASVPGAGGAGFSAASSAARAPAAPGFDTIGGVSTTTAPWAGGGGITYARVPPRVGGDRIGGVNSMASPSVPVLRGGAPDLGPPPPSSFPRGVPGRANNQFAVTKAPWAKD